jgi:Phage integrase family
VLLAGTVGARQNEWFTLTERQLELDGDEPVMRVPRTLNKSRRPKAIPLTSREALLLKEQLLARAAGTSLVFANRKGKQWNRHRFREQVWQACNRGGRIRVARVPPAPAHGDLAHVRGRDTGPSGLPSASATPTVERSS